MRRTPTISISLDSEDLAALDAMVTDRQRQNPQEIASRTAVIRDLIRAEHQSRGHHHVNASKNPQSNREL